MNTMLSRPTADGQSESHLMRLLAKSKRVVVANCIFDFGQWYIKLTLTPSF